MVAVCLLLLTTNVSKYIIKWTEKLYISGHANDHSRPRVVIASALTDCYVGLALLIKVSSRNAHFLIKNSFSDSP